MQLHSNIALLHPFLTVTLKSRSNLIIILLFFISFRHTYNDLVFIIVVEIHAISKKIPVNIYIYISDLIDYSVLCLCLLYFTSIPYHWIPYLLNVIFVDLLFQ